MSNQIALIRQGDSLPFEFSRSGESLDGFVCTISVKKYIGDTAEISREIPADGLTFPGFLTSTETAALDITTDTPYRLIGLMVSETTGEQETAIERFHLTEEWA